MRQATQQNDNVVCKEALLKTIPYPRDAVGKKILLRQQKHTDWTTPRKEAWFWILALEDNQHVWIENPDDPSGMTKVNLNVGDLLIASSFVVHAGSEYPGLRLHGIFVPQKTMIDDMAETEETYYVQDISHPS